MSYLTLDPSWTAPSSCLASTAYHYMVVKTYDAGIIFSEMFGAPTPLMMSVDPTGSCIPPGFTTDTPYMTDGPCPAGYTEACATKAVFSGTPASSVTCCPSAFKFNCHGEVYGCVAKATKGEVWTGTRTDIAITPNTQMPETHTAYEGEAMWAWGIKFIRTPPATGSPSTRAQETDAGTRGTMATVPTAGVTSLATTATASRAPSTGDDGTPGAAAAAPATGISPATAAGVGVGAAAGLLLVALAAWLLYRRHRRRRAAPPAQPPYYHAPVSNSYPPHEYYAQPPYPRHKAELGAPPVEMQ